jgi:hypothetical protein
MRRLFLIIAISAAALGAMRVIAFPRGCVLVGQRSTPGSSAGTTQVPPTEAEQRALIDRLFSNQHSDDAALPLYQRIEHHQIREHASDNNPTEDKTFRVIPIGTGTGWRVLVEDHGRPIPTADYRMQLANVQRALEIVTDPVNAVSKRDIERFQRRLKDRADLISAVRNAFTFTWLGREVRNGRTLAKFRLAPNPNYRPVSRETEIFLHASATIWADEAAGQVVRAEAELTSDFSVGGGVLGKVYRGSRMTLEQTEIAPGVWFPFVLQYDFTGRRFFFGFEINEHTEASHYERIGPPNEALTFIRRELSSSKAPRAQQ